MPVLESISHSALAHKAHGMAAAGAHYKRALGVLQREVEALLAPSQDPFEQFDTTKAKERIRRAFAKAGMDPEDRALTDARLRLLLDTTRQSVEGEAHYQAGLAQAGEAPAWELYRREDREEPRDWHVRWQEACDEAGDEQAAAALERHGRMVAHKRSGVWQALGEGAGGYSDTLGKPYPPFAFNSGMWTREVSKGRAGKLGFANTTPAEVESAAAQTDANPSQAQKEAGNYAKGKVTVHGLEISIENPKGGVRSGVGKDGKEWSVEMAAHYGYFLKTVGKDGDHVDCYIGDNPESERVFVVDQLNADTGAFDEHKVLLGFDSEHQARNIYLAGFSDGKGAQRLGAITEVPVTAFKYWLRRGNTKRPFAEGAVAAEVANSGVRAYTRKVRGKTVAVREYIRGGTRVLRLDGKAADRLPSLSDYWMAPDGRFETAHGGHEAHARGQHGVDGDYLSGMAAKGYLRVVHHASGIYYSPDSGQAITKNQRELLMSAAVLSGKRLIEDNSYQNAPTPSRELYTPPGVTPYYAGTVTEVANSRGAGTHPHAGRPGLVGGSAPSQGAIRPKVKIEAEVEMPLLGSIRKKDYNQRVRDLRARGVDIKKGEFPSGDFVAAGRYVKVGGVWYADIGSHAWLNKQNETVPYYSLREIAASSESLRAWDKLNKKTANETVEQRKERAANGIADSAKVKPAAARAFISGWDKSSNDHNPEMLQAQKLAAEMFGGHFSKWQKSRWEKLGRKRHSVKSKEDQQRKMLQAMYDNTQRLLKQAGVKEMLLFRGTEGVIEGKAGTAIQLRGNAMESWSASIAVARDFGDRLVAMRVPASRIVALPATGFGCSNEMEVVVLGIEKGDRCLVL